MVLAILFTILLVCLIADVLAIIIGILFDTDNFSSLVLITSTIILIIDVFAIGVFSIIELFFVVF